MRDAQSAAHPPRIETLRRSHYDNKMKNTALKIFFFCLFTCAALFLVMLWFFQKPPQTLSRVVATLFVVGLTSFLVWFVPAVRGIWSGVSDKNKS